jgi:hypothetical protein
MNDDIDLPESFLARYVDHHELAALMSETFGVEITESVMLSLVACGKTPVGVNLMPLAGLPYVVWERQEIETWAALGFPLPPALVALEQRVRDALETALAEEGRTLPERHPAHPCELN